MATITKEQRAVWLAERRTGLGGSDDAKILHDSDGNYLSKWGTEVDVWLDKLGKSEEKPANLAMKMGNYLEPLGAEEFIEATGKRLIEYVPTIHGQGENSCFLGNLDRVVVEEGQNIDEMVMRLQGGDLSCIESILEIKTAVRIEDWTDDNGNLIVPGYYRAQVLHYMGLIPSCKRCYVAVIFTGLHKSFQWLVVERNQELIDRMFGYLRGWWQKHIVEGVMPEPVSVKEVAMLWPKSEPDSVLSLKALSESDKESDRELAAELRKKYEIFKKVTSDVSAFESEIVNVWTNPENGNEVEETREELLDRLQLEITNAMKGKENLLAEDGDTVLCSFKSDRDTVRDVTDWEKVAKDIAGSCENGAALYEEAVEANTEKGKVVRRGARKFKLVGKKRSEMKARKGGRKAA